MDDAETDDQLLTDLLAYHGDQRFRPSRREDCSESKRLALGGESTPGMRTPGRIGAAPKRRLCLSRGTKDSKLHATMANSRLLKPLSGGTHTVLSVVSSNSRHFGILGIFHPRPTMLGNSLMSSEFNLYEGSTGQKMAKHDHESDMTALERSIPVTRRSPESFTRRDSTWTFNILGSISPDSRFKTSVSQYRLAAGSSRAYENTLDDASRGTGPRRIKLLLTHGASFHKEMWEPFLKELQAIQQKFEAVASPIIVTEAWAIDCLNHGEASVINEHLLVHYPGLISNRHYARSCMTLLESGLVEDLDLCKLVLIGHSAGAITGLILADLYQQQACTPFSSVVLVDPVFTAATGKTAPSEQKANTIRFVESTKRRVDIWPSKGEAVRWLAGRRPFKTWDPRVLKIFVDDGLRPLPTAWYPEYAKGVTLKCHKLQESAAYSNTAEQGLAAGLLPTIAAVVPVIVIFGEQSPFRVSEVNLSKDASIPVRIIPRCTHYVLQESPKELAVVVHGRLQEMYKHTLLSRL
ncbi:hypothetical protein EVG20_g6800 [Dentipellis fragilis]|uniref:AB hydrolase-1 domain-containing protein n=1 Tax=Dentipellis fragilis TaxID=205917 RepID=A0A4Y9YL19_9AGAM|nr:hypothetical protein EVG20_g6800 [Dentipellis fragilis]